MSEEPAAAAWRPGRLPRWWLVLAQILCAAALGGVLFHFSERHWTTETCFFCLEERKREALCLFGRRIWHSPWRNDSRYAARLAEYGERPVPCPHNYQHILTFCKYEAWFFHDRYYASMPAGWHMTSSSCVGDAYWVAVPEFARPVASIHAREVLLDYAPGRLDRETSTRLLRTIRQNLDRAGPYQLAANDLRSIPPGDRAALAQWLTKYFPDCAAPPSHPPAPGVPPGD